MKYDIFISYPSQEINLSLDIYNFFKSNYKIFLDNKCLKGGDDDKKIIPNAQKEALVTIILISKNTKYAHYQNSEITRAIKLKRKSFHLIIPILIFEEKKPEIPFGLENIQYLKITNKEFKLNRLLNDISDSLKKNITVLEKNRTVIRPKNVNNFSFNKNYNEEQLLKNFLKEFNKLDKTREHSLLFLDVDRFTQINKKYGKQIGDEIISTIYDILFDYNIMLEFNFDENEVYFERLYSDEFIILLPNFGFDKTKEFAVKIYNTLKTNDWSFLNIQLFAEIKFGTSIFKISNLNQEFVKTQIIKAALGCNKLKKEGKPILVTQSEIKKDVLYWKNILQRGPGFLSSSALRESIRSHCS